MGFKGWIGIDLDGTLALDDNTYAHGRIGPPVARMVERIREWRAAGRDVRIFTARANDPDCLPPIEAYCLEHLGEVLPITATKDYGMEVLYDDRCVQIVKNTGMTVLEHTLSQQGIEQ